MKSKFLVFILVFAIISVLIFSCTKSTEPEIIKNAVLAVDLESAFKNDSVRIEINNDLLVQKRVSTNYTISAAWGSGPKVYPQGNYTLQIEIFNYNLQKKYAFYLNDTLTVCIRFEPQNEKIQFSTFDGLIFRD